MDLPSRILCGLDRWLLRLDQRGWAFNRRVTSLTQKLLSKPQGRRTVDPDRCSAVPGSQAAIRMFRPLSGDALFALVYLHGGGFCLGGGSSYDGICAYLASALQATVFAVDYGLSPESPMPGAIVECEQALTQILLQWPEYSENFMLMGDSAGGYLAAVLHSRLYARKASPPFTTVLLYPCLNPDLDSKSWQQHGHGKLLSRRLMERFLQAAYPNGKRLAELDQTQFIGSFSAEADGGRLSVYAAAFDPLRDDAAQLAGVARDQQVAVFYSCFAQLPHGFIGYYRASRRAQNAVDAICEQILKDFKERKL